MFCDELLNYDEIHKIGIDIVSRELINIGFQIESILPDLSMNPQIVANYNNQKTFILVRTSAYPNMGMLESDDFSYQFLNYSKNLGVNLFFESLSIANSDGTNSIELGMIKRANSYNIESTGLIRISDSTIKSLFSNNKIKTINKDAEVAGSVEILEDGRSVIHKDTNSDFVSFITSIFIVISNSITDEQKSIFSQWANLPKNVWSNTHRQDFALAMMHYFLELKSNGDKIPEKFIGVLNLLKPMMLPPLKKPLTNEIRNLFRACFGW